MVNHSACAIPVILYCSQTFSPNCLTKTLPIFKIAYICYQLPVVQLTLTFVKLLSPSTSIHVNVFLPILSVTCYILFILTLQMLCLLLTFDLLNSFDVELLFIETPSSVVSLVIL